MTPRPLRVLVLGGTVFAGRHIVEALLARDAEVTLFHRGEHGRDLFPDVARILGDRRSGLARLPRDARWDAVVDTCGFAPDVVAASAGALRERAARYVFISSISVYDLTQAPIDEASRTLPLPPGASRDAVTPETYGPLKALCEREAVSAFGAERALSIRPGLIAGPHDPTDRFTYWPVRFARGGAVLVPDDLDAPVQFIDVRDLARFVVDAIANERSGVVNAVGPAHVLTLGAFVASCRDGAGVEARPARAPLAWLRERGVEPWSDLPVWAPAGTGVDGVSRVDPAHAIALGLRHRPVRETVADTLRWAREERGDAPLRAGLAPEREAALLRELACDRPSTGSG